MTTILGKGMPSQREQSSDVSEPESGQDKVPRCNAAQTTMKTRSMRRDNEKRQRDAHVSANSVTHHLLKAIFAVATDSKRLA